MIHRDLSRYKNLLGRRNKFLRLLWSVVWLFLFRPSPRPAYAWRALLLRLFGAKLEPGTRVAASVTIWAPWNLETTGCCWIGDGVDCYNVDTVKIEKNAVVSQRAFLCTASHDYLDPGFALITSPITIAEGAWVAAEAFLAPGVRVGQGAIVGARACVFRDVEPGVLVGGNPARVLRTIDTPRTDRRI